MQRTRRQEVEVGDEGTETGDVLDPADQRLMGRVVLVDDGGAVLAAVVDNDVDLVGAEAGLGDGLLECGRDRHPVARLHRRQKIVGVLLNIALDRIEILRDIGQVLITGTQLVHHHRNRGAGRLAVELAHCLTVVAFPLRNLPHDRFELTLDFFQIVLDPLALGLRERLEHLRRQHLAVAPRCQRQSHWRAHHRDAFLLGTPLQLAKGVLVALFELLLDDIEPRPVVVAFEGRRQRSAQFLDEPPHRFAEPGGAPRRELQAARLLRVGKVVDIAPVGRRRHAICPLPQQLFDNRMFADAAGPESIDVVALASHANSELHRLDRAILANRPRWILELPRPTQTVNPSRRRAGRAAPREAGARARQQASRLRLNPARDNLLALQ